MGPQTIGAYNVSALIERAHQASLLYLKIWELYLGGAEISYKASLITTEFCWSLLA